MRTYQIGKCSLHVFVRTDTNASKLLSTANKRKKQIDKKQQSKNKEKNRFSLCPGLK